MENDKPLQRICTACGLTKPLSAFLYISSTRGTTYGSLCSACRGAEMERKELALGDEESGSTRAQLKIGAAEKLHIELEWERRLQEKKQQALEQKKKNEHTKTHKTEEVELAHEEKKRHPSGEALEKKPEQTPEAPPPDIQKPKGDEPAINPTVLNPEKDREILLQEKQQLDRKEQRLGGALVNIDPQQTTVARQNVVSRGFLDFLGESSAAAREIIQKRRAAQQQLFSHSKNQKATAARENASGKSPDEKPGFQKKK